MQKQQICKEDLKGQFQIDYNGQWHHEGSPIKRHELVKLFSTILRKEEDGYVLRTPHEVAQVIVEDAPYIIVKMSVRNKDTETQEIEFISNIDKSYKLDDTRQLYLENEKPYLELEHGLKARLNTSTYYELVELMDINDTIEKTGLWSYGHYKKIEHR